MNDLNEPVTDETVKVLPDLYRGFKILVVGMKASGVDGQLTRVVWKRHQEAWASNSRNNWPTVAHAVKFARTAIDRDYSQHADELLAGVSADHVADGDDAGSARETD